MTAPGFSFSLHLVAAAAGVAGCASLAHAQASPVQDLSLVCNVNGQNSVTASTNSFGKDQDGNDQWRTGTQEQIVPFTGRLVVAVEVGRARALMPIGALPAIHGGNDGWFEIRDLRIGDDEIRGKVAINFLDHADLRIDRRSGGVTFRGLQSSFSGQCEKLDPTRRAF